MNRCIIVSSTDIDTFLKAVDNHLEHGFKVVGFSVIWEDEKIIGSKRVKYFMAMVKQRTFKIGKEDKKMRPENQTGI